MFQLSPMTTRVVIFALLSVGDFLLTRWLLSHPASLFYETNPIAAWVLTEFQWGGLAFFKTGCVLLTLWLCVCIGQSRPRSAERILTVGCLVLSGVVGYSTVLAQSFYDPQTQQDLETLQDNENHLRELNAQLKPKQELLRFEEKLYRDLKLGNLTLQDAVEKVYAEEPRLMSKSLLQHESTTDPETAKRRLAKSIVAPLIFGAVKKGDFQQAYRWEQEFHRYYGGLDDSLEVALR